MTALVTGAHTRAALATVRSLGRAGIAVCVGGPVRPALAMWSRYATSTVLLPDARSAARAFAQRVADEAEGRKARVVLATTDAELWALSRFREVLPGHLVQALPNHDALARLRSRGALYDLARARGVRTADRLRIDHGVDLEASLREAAALRFPVLVWPRVSGRAQAQGDAASRPLRARSIAELRRLMYERRDLVEHGVSVEPDIPGQRIGYGVVCAPGGEVIAEVFRERVRELKARSGVTTWSRTIDPDVEVREKSRALIDALLWRGPIFFEWARDEDELVLVGVVERIWNAAQLAIDGGVDVPLLSYRVAEGERPIPARRVAEAGLSLRWWMGDLERALLHTVGEEGGGLKARFRALGAWGRPRRMGRVRADVFATDDPLPFAFEMRGAVRALRRTVS